MAIDIDILLDAKQEYVELKQEFEAQCKKPGWSRLAYTDNHQRTRMLEAKQKVNKILTKMIRDEAIRVLKEFDGTLLSIETPYGKGKV